VTAQQLYLAGLATLVLSGGVALSRGTILACIIIDTNVIVVVELPPHELMYISIISIKG
jgi:hypothetical protein